MQLTPGTTIEHDGRPAVVITRPEIGATGDEIVGIRYQDVPRWLDVPGFPGMRRPNGGAIVKTADLARI